MRRKLILSSAVTVAAVASVAGAMTALASPMERNVPPRVALTSPVDGSFGVLGCPITFAADARDSDDEVAQSRPIGPDVPVTADDGIDRVEFYVNGHLLATDDTAPYQVTTDQGPFQRGGNTGFARAYDDDKPQLSADSQTVSFRMVDPPPAQPGDVDECLRATPPTSPTPWPTLLDDS